MNNNKDEIVLFENGELALEVNVSPQLETVWLVLKPNGTSLWRVKKPFEACQQDFYRGRTGTREQHAKNACCWCQSAGCFL